MKEKALAEEKLDVVIEKYMEEQGIPGMAIGIIKDNELLLTKGYGYKNLATKEPINEDSLFHMASVSKTFVATGIMQLYEKGKIDIYKPLVYYIPYFKAKGDKYKEITIQNMLSHTSGITYVDDSLWGQGPYDDGALEYYVRSLSELELMWDPGEKFYYNNTLYEVLGHIIGKVSGMTFEDYIKENILEPLEMSKSTFLKREVDIKLGTNPHIMSSKVDGNVKVSEVYPYNRMHAPSSTLHSNINEMINFGRMYLNKGVFNGKRILEESSYDSLFESRMKFVRNNKDSEIGLTWFVDDYKGHKVYSHSGGDTGFNSKIAIVPDKNAFVVFMANCDFTNVDAINSTLLDIALGYEPEPIKISPNKALINAINKEGMKGAYNTLDTIKKHGQDKYTIRESDLYNLAYMYMEEKQLELAVDLFKMGIKEYPNSSSFYNGLGECYLQKGDKELAVESYKKAYELNPGDFIAKQNI